MQAGRERVCQLCVVGKLRRSSHPSRMPQPMRVLHRVHIDLSDLPHRGYFGTVIDEATRFATVELLPRKSDAAAAVRRALTWCETQTDLCVQRVRRDRGGEYMGCELQRFYEERGIQREPTPGYSPECNGIADRHNLTLLDIARSMLADSRDERLGLAPLGERFAGHAVMYANDLHNATPASGAQKVRPPFDGFLGREVTLGGFRRFGCRVWVHQPGKPFVTPQKKVCTPCSARRVLGL
jgi:hypothetical protein